MSETQEAELPSSKVDTPNKKQRSQDLADDFFAGIKSNKETQDPKAFVRSTLDSATKLDSITTRRRYESLNEDPLSLSEIEQGVEKILKEKQAIADVLQAWKISYDESTEKLHQGGISYESEFWDKQTKYRSETLGGVFFFGIRRGEMNKLYALDSEAERNLQRGGLEIMRRLVRDPEFNAKSELADYLNFRLWRSYQMREEISAGPSGKIGPSYKIMDSRYQKEKEYLIPVISEIGMQYAQGGDQEQVDNIFEGFLNAGAKEEAEELLLSETSMNAGVTLAIGYINNFGFIPAIDAISKKLKQEDLSDDLRGRLEFTYSALEGQEVQQIIAELTELYESVYEEFQEYAYYPDELTSEEVDMLMEDIKYHEQRKRNPESKDSPEVDVLDLGAGYGRISLALAKRLNEGSLKNVNLVALEFDEEFVRQMKEALERTGLDVEVHQGDWNDLSDIFQRRIRERGVFDEVSSLGRTISHARTPQEMLHLFDEVNSVLDFGGRFKFDMPDIEWGVYKERIEQIRINLEKKGIKKLRSNVIFDGPNDLKYNRQVLTVEQVKALEFLMGYKSVGRQEKKVGEEDEINNVYYTLEKDENFDPTKIGREELGESLVTLGLLDPGTDFNMYVKAWGMTLGQALMYGLDAEDIRRANLAGHIEKVQVTFDGDKMYFKTMRRGSLDQ